MLFLSIFSISLRMLLHNNELKYGFDTRCQTQYCSIFLLISFQSILIPSLNYHTRTIHTGAKCFVLNRGIEMTRWDGMSGLLLPTELCMSLCISKKNAYSRNIDGSQNKWIKCLDVWIYFEWKSLFFSITIKASHHII